MKNKAFIFIMILFNTIAYSQESKITVNGTIKSDGADLESIHIVNKNTKIGTITNAEGNFTIEVKEKDTLIVTGVQFYYVEVPITNQHVKTKKITIDLIQKMNELEEVEITHNLTGNMVIDGNSVKVEKHVKGDALNFSKIDLDLVGVKMDHKSRSRTSSDNQLMPNMNPDLLAIASLLLKPIGKIGATKRNIKKYERLHNNKVLEAPEKIRTDFGDTFFTETLKIPAHHIDEFITYCVPKGVAQL